MRVLIVKTSSLGDVIHTLPALTDASKMLPGIRFDWVVEKGFADIPKWHPTVSEVIPVNIRHWRKHLFKKQTFLELKQFWSVIRKTKYDFIIDAQGLIKSAILTILAKGHRCGLDWISARESLASLFYQKKYVISKDQHAIHRIRELFSNILNYSILSKEVDYGINKKYFASKELSARYLIFLHGTTWDTKHWPESHWLALAKLAVQNGFQVKLPWGNEIEKKRAEKIATEVSSVEVLPRSSLNTLAKYLANAAGVVAVDTGLGHLSAALNTPTLSLYGPTNPILTGTQGQFQTHLVVDFSCAPCLKRQCQYLEKSHLKLSESSDSPCFMSLSAKTVWSALEKLLKAKESVLL